MSRRMPGALVTLGGNGHRVPRLLAQEVIKELHYIALNLGPVVLQELMRRCTDSTYRMNDVTRSICWGHNLCEENGHVPCNIADIVKSELIELSDGTIVPSSLVNRVVGMLKRMVHKRSAEGAWVGRNAILEMVRFASGKQTTLEQQAQQMLAAENLTGSCHPMPDAVAVIIRARVSYAVDESGKETVSFS